ncbi:thioesterase family protein [Massilia sp. TS11]|uniref:acyl-CoA thioesterase n=1 Tax=Massilia sp. TS11 TaxID=2908003 RepID=UPI001EDA0C2E|nr:thioesterase family protein [Massilia sp. TS11]MCG2582955.1 acyl-CoA thioesterase [Massilia sp. TS11]
MRDTPRAAFAAFLSLPTRWHDNDIYGHVNNVVYYALFDTAVNQYLISHGVLDIHGGAVIAYVVDSGCAYFRPIAFPDLVHAGLRVSKLGSSSVRYEIGLYRNDETVPAAVGHFVHVYVDRASQRPVPIPPATRALLQTLA